MIHAEKKLDLTRLTVSENNMLLFEFENNE